MQVTRRNTENVQHVVNRSYFLIVETSFYLDPVSLLAFIKIQISIQFGLSGVCTFDRKCLKNGRISMVVGAAPCFGPRPLLCGPFGGNHVTVTTVRVPKRLVVVF